MNTQRIVLNVGVGGVGGVGVVGVAVGVGVGGVGVGVGLCGKMRWGPRRVTSCSRYLENRCQQPCGT